MILMIYSEKTNLFSMRFKMANNMIFEMRSHVITI